MLGKSPIPLVQCFTDPIEVSSDDQVKAYIKKIMSQLNKWMLGGKISKLVIVITSKETGQHVERWQFDVRFPDLSTVLDAHIASQVQLFNKSGKSTSTRKSADKENNIPESAFTPYQRLSRPNHVFYREIEQPVEKTEKEIQDEIQSIFRQITASVTFLPQLDGNCTFNVLVYADAASEVPLEWADSDAKEIKDAEKVQLRSFSTSNHRVDTLVSYRFVWSSD